MGDYVTQTSIYTALPGLTNNSATSALIDACIMDAESFVNGKIAIRYVTPFSASVCPPIIRTITKHIACYYSFRSLFSQDNQNYNNYLDSFKESQDYLDEIRKGDIDLSGTDGALFPTRTVTSADVLTSNIEDRQPFFDIDDPKEWKFNSDIEDEIRGKR